MIKQQLSLDDERNLFIENRSRKYLECSAEQADKQYEELWEELEGLN